jgi:hypothetical protein
VATCSLGSGGCEHVVDERLRHFVGVGGRWIGLNHVALT